MSEKPTVVLVGEDGNVFNIIGRVKRALKDAGYVEEAKEFAWRCLNECPDYDSVLRLAMEYCEVE